MRFSFSAFLPGIVLFSSLSHAQNTCSLATLTNNCEMFSEDTASVQFPDGSSIQNLSYIPPKPPAPHARVTTPDQSASLQESALDFQLHSMTILDKHAQTPVSEKFKIFAASNLYLFGMIKGPQPDSTSISWVMPMDSESGTVQATTLGEVRRQLKKFYKADDLDSLSNDGRLYQMDYGTLSDTGTGTGTSNSEVTAETGQSLSDDRVAILIENAKKSIEKVILDGRSPSDLSPVEQEEIDRVSQIVVLPRGTNGDFCGTAPNAGYDGGTNTISVCESAYSLPEPAFVALIGHELSHSIDPCGFQFGLLVVNEEKLSQAKKGKYPPDIITKLAQSAIVTSQLFSYPVKGNDQLYKNLLDDGVLKRFSPDHAASDYPFASLINCLSSDSGGGFRSFTDQEKAKYISDLNKQNFPAESVALLASSLKKYPQCDYLEVSGQRSQLSEATADWFGTQVLAEYLRNPSRKNEKTPNIEAVSWYANSSCNELNQLNPSNADAQIATLPKFFRDSHPLTGPRGDRIALRNPTVAMSVGCAPPDKPQCSLRNTNSKTPHNSNSRAINETTFNN